MTSEQFAYWMQGFFEISGESTKKLTEEQVDMIKSHLELVFKHEIDPSYSDNKELQNKMNQIHAGTDSKKNLNKKTTVYC